MIFKKKKKNGIQTRLKIVELLQNEPDPLILNHIAKKIGDTPQLVDFHLRNLVSDGIVRKIENKDEIKYHLQPYIYSKQFKEVFEKRIGEWAVILEPYLDLANADDEVDAILNNLYMIMREFLLAFYEDTTNNDLKK